MSELSQLQPGRVFGGDYRILRRLGEGGMGAVYVVEQLSTSAERALKLMRPELVQDPDMRRRFHQEAKVSASIRSDHVVQVLAAGVDSATEAPFLVMELLEGAPLSDVIRRGPVPAAEVREIAAQLCHALGAAHRAGVVHRDLKPENIFLAPAQRAGVPFTVKVLDFGIAKVIAESMTRTTVPIGTPLWMAPEQTTQGQAIVPGTDLWALGLIVFTMLTGRHFWRSAEGDTNPVALLREVVLEPIPAASQRAAEQGSAHRLPPGFDAWFARCVARDPRERFQDAAEAQVALAALLGGARPSGPQPAINQLPTAAPAGYQPPPPPLAPFPARPPDAAWRDAGPHPKQAGASTSGAAWVLAGTVGVVLLLATVAVAALFGLRSATSSGPEPEGEEPTAIQPPAEPPVEPPAEATGVVETPPPFPQQPGVVNAPAIPIPGPTPPPAIPFPGATVTPPPTATSGRKREFDRAAAASALSAAAASARSCKRPGGPTGVGTVQVTFGPSGAVTQATVATAPFAGTPVGICVAGVFRTARVPPFDTAPVTASKSFTIN